MSVFFWFLTKLSKDYNSTIQYPIAYENLPEDKLLQKKLQESIDIHVKASGFKILSGKLFPKTLTVDAANLQAKSSTEYYLLLSKQRLALQRKMNTGVTIDHFTNDSILLSLGRLEKKKIPVTLVSDLAYRTGFDLSGKMMIEPDSIIVSGPEAILDTISQVVTEVFVQKDINTSLSKIIPLKKIDKDNNVTFNVNSVTLKATVEKFTEGTIKVPFRISNVPEGVTISTFPKELDLTYKVALSAFNQIKASSFLIVCDYKLSSENKLSYLLPRLIKQSDLVKNVKITQSKIDFIIER